MSTLSVQASTYATLLSIISKSNKNNHIFALSVIEKLIHQKLLKSIIDNDVLTSKIVLRSLACILSCHSLTLEGDEGFAGLLESLITIAYASWNDTNSTNTTIGGAGVGGSDTLLSELGQAVIYLLATTLPWSIVVLLHTQTGASLVDRCIPLFTRIITEYRSLYSTGGKLAIFHMDNLLVDEDTTNYELSHIHLGPSVPGSPVCWDNLWESCKSAIDIITLAKADPKIFTLPSCMLCPWIELSDMLNITTTALPLEGGENEVEQSSDITNEISSLTLGSTFITAFHTALTDKQTSTTTPTTTSTHTSTTSTTPITWLEPCFSVFDPNSSEDASIICTTLNRIEKTVIIDYYRDIIYFFDPVIRYDGSYIGTINTLCKHLLSLSKILPSQLNTLPFEYILVELLLVQLSLSTYNSIYHGLICRIVLELCKTATSFPPVLALGMSVIYQLGSDFDSSVWRNYASWLSFHLVNTKLIWPYWVHWAEEYEASVDVTSESKLLLKLVIDKCAHAMVPESVRQAVPDELKELVVAERGPYCSLFDPDNADEQGIVYICIYFLCRIYSCIRVYVNLCMYTNTISVMP